MNELAKKRISVYVYIIYPFILIFKLIFKNDLTLLYLSYFNLLFLTLLLLFKKSKVVTFTFRKK